MADDATIIAAPGREIINGHEFWIDDNGSRIAAKAVKAKDKLQDELVRKIVGYAEPLSEQIARFRQHTFDDVDAFVALLEQEHGAKRGGTKGNLVFYSFDGLTRVKVSIAEQVHYGPELQVAKGLVDECMADWTSTAGPELQTIVTHAFRVDQAGKVSRTALLSLRRYDFDDGRWLRAMKAIADAERPISSKRYVLIHRRDKTSDGWSPVSISMASV